MSWGTKTRGLARRLGYDVYQHMAGGRRIPLRVRRVPRIGPFDVRARAIPEQFDVEVARCTSFVAFSFDPDGWNPLVETLREHVADPGLTYEGSTLGRLHERFRPDTLQELFFGTAVERPLSPLDEFAPARRFYRYIWETSPALVAAARRDPPGRTDNYSFGPLPAEQGRAEFDRLIAAFVSIRDEGYRPERYGYVTGYLLGDETDHRFVIGSGNHRVAALAVLGKPRLTVRLHSHPAVIHRSQLDSWTTPEGGPFEPATAAALFELMLTGRPEPG